MTNFFCEKCRENKSFEDDISVWDIGFFWCKLWVTSCPDCDGTIFISEEPIEYFEKFETYRAGREGVAISSISREDRVKTGDLLEMWIQEYFLENFPKYGFSEVEGPFKRGPDFRGKRIGEKSFEDIEIERYWQNYFSHGHHRSKAFDKVKILIVLGQNTPPENKLKELPSNIIYLDNNHFINWAMPKFEQEKVSPIVKIISEAFMAIYALNCDRSRSDLSLCPRCLNCAYFDNGTNFSEMALQFLIENDFFPFLSDFSISEVSSKKMYLFYRDYMMKRVLTMPLA